MEEHFILVVVALSSIGAYVVGVKELRLSGRGTWQALGKTLECLGIMLVFFLVNLAAGAIVILSMRVLTQGVLSLYLIGDETLLVLSLLQGLAFQWWREQSAPSPG